MKNLLPALLACIAISGCAQVTPYRTELKPVAKPCIAASPSECPHDAFFLVRDSVRGDGIPIGIVEFDDQGVLQNREFKDKIMNRIRVLTNEHGTLTVVFAHGWLNNASPENENLAHFQEMLKGIATGDREICKDRPSCRGRKVVGVYLAWRGMSATVQPFKSLSFWNRKSRAHRVGQDGATEVLAELAKVKSASKARAKSRLILIGHSFGGALIYSAIQQLFMKDAAFVPGAGESVRRTAADLVILVNPAFEAARLTSLREKAAGISFPETQSPILAIFTSKTDKATKWAFPLGRRLSSLFTKYNPGRPGQSKLDRTAVGHYPGYQTHELCLKDKDADLATRVDSVCEWERFRKGETNAWNLGSVVLERKDLAMNKNQRMNPYYNVVVDDAIISGHSGIWKPKFFMEFISRFVTVQEAKRCEQYQPGWRPKSSPAVSGCPSD